MTAELGQRLAISTVKRRPNCDDDWRDLAANWNIRRDTTYLNHGSFGPPPERVRQARRALIDALDCQPMDFFVREHETRLINARIALAEFVGTSFENLVFAENATFAMNVVADSFRLRPDDEVLLTDHEYGAVQRIWARACARAGASSKIIQLPETIHSREQVVETIVNGIGPNSRIVVVSHITSPTAIILPVAEIVAACKSHGVAVCIDGPHAPAQVDVGIDQLDCDFYCASCHKWLSAPFGSGFLYVHPRHQRFVEPQLKSWGRLLPNLPARWDEEFTWSGTRDPSAYLAVPAAIDFINQVGLENFRSRCYWLARYAESRLMELTRGQPIAPIVGGWYGTMCHVPLGRGDWADLQIRLWREQGIEVPIIFFQNRWFVRVSCHLYNTMQQIDRLVAAIAKLR